LIDELRNQKEVWSVLVEIGSPIVYGQPLFFAGIGIHPHDDLALPVVFFD
jgi:hypothetical protein